QLGGQPLVRLGVFALHHVKAEVEELLEQLQVLVRLLPPLAETDEDEVLLYVALLFGEGVQPGVLDGDGGLVGETLGTLHLAGAGAAAPHPPPPSSSASAIWQAEASTNRARLRATRASVCSRSIEEASALLTSAVSSRSWAWRRASS